MGCRRLITANIAVYFHKRSKTNKICYLNIVRGSVEEYRYYLILAKILDTMIFPKTKL
ncbi:four helix bundle protein [Pelotomaculum isophthalicicum]|uniref:four helix bundle protein n=1 Tax=Pelotomaculum isophthalicicum TaxID=342448 RepID=UPI003B847FC8